MVLTPAGAEAPGTSTTCDSMDLEFNQRYLSWVYWITIYKYRYNVLFFRTTTIYIFQ